MAQPLPEEKKSEWQESVRLQKESGQTIKSCKKLQPYDNMQLIKTAPQSL